MNIIGNVEGRINVGIGKHICFATLAPRVWIVPYSYQLLATYIKSESKIFFGEYTNAKNTEIILQLSW